MWLSVSFPFPDPHTYLESNGLVVEKTMDKVISKGVLTALMFYDKSDYILKNDELGVGIWLWSMPSWDPSFSLY